MNKRKKGLILTVIGLFGLVAITVGVTFAFFSYTKEGTTENSITTGTITFLYTEVSGVGRGISIDDAYPVSDSVGKVQTGEGKAFDFKVTSTTINETTIPYEVTARKKSTSDLDESVVKLYLTKVAGEKEEVVLLDNYSDLTQTSKVSKDKHVEKTIYQGNIPAGSTNYEQNFRLRMWIDENVDFSPVKDENGNDTYPYNDKNFTVTVNVYANAKVVTDGNQSTTPVGFVPTYFEFGTPTTSSTTDYTTLGKNVFAGLGEDGSKGICINDGGLFCIKNNDYENSVASLKAHFKEENCSLDSSNVNCGSESFHCYAYFDGRVDCVDYTVGTYCYVYSSGSVKCN